MINNQLPDLGTSQGVGGGGEGGWEGGCGGAESLPANIGTAWHALHRAEGAKHAAQTESLAAILG